MFAGDFASDMVRNGAQRDSLMLGVQLQRERTDHNHTVNLWKRELDKTNDAHAANLGIRFALEAQLALLDPENPLLIDEALRSNIQDAAINAATETNGFEAAREVGRKYPIPARARLQPPDLLALKEQLSTAYAGNLAVRNVLAKQLFRFDPKNPMLVDQLLVERVKANGAAAYKIFGDDYSAARDVGDTFVVPGRG